jgi:hypothetical protein
MKSAYPCVDMPAVWLTDEDVHVCEARLGDLKPHRHNFRIRAHGHVHDRLAEEEDEEEEEEEEGKAQVEVDGKEEEEPSGLRVLIPSTSSSSIKQRSFIQLPSLQDSTPSSNNMGSFTQKRVVWKQDAPTSSDPPPRSQDLSARPQQLVVTMETATSSSTPASPPPSMANIFSASNSIERRSISRLAVTNSEDASGVSPNLAFLSRDSYRDRSSRTNTPPNPLSRTSAGTPQSRSGKIPPFFKVSLDTAGSINQTSSPTTSPFQSESMQDEVTVVPTAPSPGKIAPAKSNSLKLGRSGSLRASASNSGAAVSGEDPFRGSALVEQPSVGPPDERLSASSRNLRLMHSKSMGSGLGSLRRFGTNIVDDVLASELASIKESLKSPRLTMSSEHWVKKKEKKKSARHSDEGRKRLSDAGEGPGWTDGGVSEPRGSSHAQQEDKKGLKIKVDSSDTDTSEGTSEGSSDMTSDEETPGPFEDATKLPSPYSPTGPEGGGSAHASSNHNAEPSRRPVSEPAMPPDASPGEDSSKRHSNEVGASSSSHPVPGNSPRSLKKINFQAAAQKILGMQTGLHSILKHSPLVSRIPASPSMQHVSNMQSGVSSPCYVSAHLHQLHGGGSPTASNQSHNLILGSIAPPSTRNSNTGSNDFLTERCLPNLPPFSSQEEAEAPLTHSSDHKLNTTASLKHGVANHLEISLLETDSDATSALALAQEEIPVGREAGSSEATEGAIMPSEEGRVSGDPPLHTTSFAFQQGLQKADKVQEEGGQVAPGDQPNAPLLPKKRVRFKEGLPGGFVSPPRKPLSFPS